MVESEVGSRNRTIEVKRIITLVGLVSQRLEERLPRVLVERDAQLRGHVVGQIHELTTGAHRDQEFGRALLDGEFGDADGIGDGIDRPAEVQPANGDQAAAEAFAQERSAYEPPA